MKEKDPGFEYIDDTPIEVPVRLRTKGAQNWAQMVQHVAHELSRRASEEGNETLEESLDFGDDNDSDLPTAAETRYMKEEELLQSALDAAKVRRERRVAAKMAKEANRGRDEVGPGVKGPGQPGEARKADAEPVPGVAQGDRKEKA